MAVEQIRGCGYRKVNGLYLCGGCLDAPCDRLPLPLTTCPVCGGGIKVSRGFTEVNPYRLWGNHDGSLVGLVDDQPITAVCRDKIRPCHLCDPQDQPAYIMLVGAGNYKTPGDFLDEATRMGISKRIPFIPKELRLGETVVYLAHPRACEVKVPAVMQQAMAIVSDQPGESHIEQPRLLEAERNEKKLGIFCAFIPQRVEKLIKESEATPEELENLQIRNITPIVVPDGDKDHA